MNGYVELGYLVVLGSLAVYSVSLATRHRRSVQTVRVVEAARLVATPGAAEHVAGEVAPPDGESARPAGAVGGPAASGAGIQTPAGRAASEAPHSPQLPLPADMGETE